MPDQDNAPQVGEPPDPARPSLSVTVPAVIVDAIRDGAYAELGWAAEEIDCAVWDGDRDAHPKRCISQLERLDAARSMLETLGWSRKVPPVDVRIDLPNNHRAFTTVLDAALMFAEDDLREAEKHDAELTARGDIPRHDATAEQINALHDFAASIRRQTDTLGAEEGTTR